VNRCWTGLHIAGVCLTLGIQHAMRMRRIISSSVVCQAVQHVSLLRQKRNDLKKKLLNINCVNFTVHFD
jgi:hypothetical protein